MSEKEFGKLSARKKDAALARTAGDYQEFVGRDLKKRIKNFRPFPSRGSFNVISSPIQTMVINKHFRKIIKKSDSKKVLFQTSSTVDALEETLGKPGYSPNDMQEHAEYGDLVSTLLAGGLIDRFEEDRKLKKRGQTGINLFRLLRSYFKVHNGVVTSITPPATFDKKAFYQELLNNTIIPYQEGATFIYEEDRIQRKTNRHDLPYLTPKRFFHFKASQVPTFGICLNKSLVRRRGGTYDVDDPIIQEMATLDIIAKMELTTMLAIYEGIDTIIYSPLASQSCEHRKKAINLQASLAALRLLIPTWKKYNIKAYVALQKPSQETKRAFQALSMELEQLYQKKRTPALP